MKSFLERNESAEYFAEIIESFKKNAEKMRALIG